jgi:hypothetical protein
MQEYVENPNSTLSSDEHKTLRDYLTGLRDHFEKYHERKENMSWLATTAYLTGITILSSTIVNNDKLNFDIWSRLVLVLAILITWWLVMKFIRKQFSDRAIAAHVVASCGEVLSMLVDPTYRANYLKAKPTCYYKDSKPYLFPQILTEQLEYRDSEQHPVSWQDPSINWYELSPIGVMFIWTTGIAAISICLPYECGCHWRTLLWMIPVFFLQILLFANVGYVRIIRDQLLSKHKLK